MPTVWQIAAGDAGRDFSWLCRKHDLMFEGPGRYGPYEKELYRKVVDRGEFSAFKIGCIGAFCEDVKPGDIVLLRRGHRVVAIGQVPDPDEEGYRHDETLDDVYGWDLCHTRRVIWQEQLDQELKALQADALLFGGRKQIPMFTQVKDPDILGPIQGLIGKCVQRPLKPRPEPLPLPLSLEELGQALFAKGLSNSAVDQVLSAIERQRRLLQWYHMFGKESGRPDEQEVVAYMVLPMLLSLGWSEQLLAVQWHKVDLAGFSGTPTTPERCVLVCEAKRPVHGLRGVLTQAAEYVEDLSLAECRKILLTQGGRFYLHRRRPDGTWEDEPSGYVNVEKIRTNHIAPANADAVETLMALTPSRSSSTASGPVPRCCTCRGQKWMKWSAGSAGR
jgi:hypothetical protein